MRSRYSAFVLNDADYLIRTWAPENRPDTIHLDENVDWQRLVVLERSGGGPFDSEGTVEFQAWYRFDGRREAQHEDSLFRREQGRWVYVGPRV